MHRKRESYVILLFSLQLQIIDLVSSEQSLCAKNYPEFCKRLVSFDRHNIPGCPGDGHLQGGCPPLRLRASISLMSQVPLLLHPGPGLAGEKWILKTKTKPHIPQSLRFCIWSRFPQLDPPWMILTRGKWAEATFPLLFILAGRDLSIRESRHGSQRWHFSVQLPAPWVSRGLCGKDCAFLIPGWQLYEYVPELNNFCTWLCPCSNSNYFEAPHFPY